MLKRLLRSDAKEVIYDEVSGKLVIIRNASVYLIHESTCILLGKINGDAPLFNSHCIHNGIIYFGQYDQNKYRKSSKIYKINKENEISIAHTFLPGQIRHVHSITNDLNIENRIWITTGDNDGECLLLYTDDNFKNKIDALESEIRRLTSVVGNFATKQDIKVLERYINFWDPIKNK